MVVSLARSRETYGHAVCGLGPAGCGFLLHAFKRGALDQLVRDGLIVIDRSRRPGTGKVGDYHLTGNSLASVFMDCIDDPDFGTFFDDLRANDPAVRAMRALGFDVPKLDLVGDFLAVMTTRFIDYLTSQYGVPILLDTAIERITKPLHGDYLLQLRQQPTGATREIAASTVIAAFGGRQPVELVARSELLPGVTLDRCRERLLMSDDFLMMSDEAIREHVRPITGADDVVVLVGGSHSAFSAVDRLTAALEPVGLRRVTMLHRGPIRLFFASAEDAKREGYPFNDPDDICPISGRVNRFGGLRYRACDVAKSVLRCGKMPDREVAVDLVPLSTCDPSVHDEVRRRLDLAPAVIACLGYQANLPPLVDADGREIELRNTMSGLEVDATGQVLTVHNEPLRSLYGYGLGSDLLKTSAAIGGEPSFSGRADGVWLYQNHGGQVILDAVLNGGQPAANWPQCARAALVPGT